MFLNDLMYKLGHSIIHFLINVISPIKILPYTMSALAGDVKNKRERFIGMFNNEVYNTGILALPMLLIIGFVAGILSILLYPFERMTFGGQNIFGIVFSRIILRELAPLVTLFTIMVRSSISITIQLTQMKINDEIETLELMGINPIQYLGTIKIIAGIAILPVLSIYNSVAALLGGMLTAYVVEKIRIIDYLKDIHLAVTYQDVFINIFRTIFCGFLIYIIAIYFGITAKKRDAVIEKSTTQVITTSVFVIIIFNILLTVSIYAAN